MNILTPQSARIAAAQRERRNALLSSAAAVLVLLLLSIGILREEQLAQPIRTPPDALGMPWDVLALAQLGVGGRRRQQQAQQAAQQAQQPGGWWPLGQQQEQLADQEARVASWRDRQRSIVFQETAAQQARAAAAASSSLGSGLSRAASALSAAAAADPFLEADRTSQGLSALSRGQPLRPLRDEAQPEAAADMAGSSTPAEAAVADE